MIKSLHRTTPLACRGITAGACVCGMLLGGVLLSGSSGCGGTPQVGADLRRARERVRQQLLSADYSSRAGESPRAGEAIERDETPLRLVPARRRAATVSPEIGPEIGPEELAELEDALADQGGNGGSGGGDGLVVPSPAAILSAQAAQASGLGEGEYLFLPNRRSVWVINRTLGRFANYDFRDNIPQTVNRSRVVSLNQGDFPTQDTVYILSDRNFTSVLWVCNQRTGDVQLWVLRGNGEVKPQGHIVTSIDLTRTKK